MNISLGHFIFLSVLVPLAGSVISLNILNTVCVKNDLAFFNYTVGLYYRLFMIILENSARRVPV